MTLQSVALRRSCSSYGCSIKDLFLHKYVLTSLIDSYSNRVPPLDLLLLNQCVQEKHELLEEFLLGFLDFATEVDPSVLAAR